MYIGVAAVDEDGVRMPDALQHLDVEGDVGHLLHGLVEGQAHVLPHLPEVAVHGVDLQEGSRTNRGSAGHWMLLLVGVLSKQTKTEP